MTDFTKTLLAVIIAATLVGTAALLRPTALEDARFSDQGELFFTAFTDPLAPASLEVVAFDANSASFEPFKVEKRDGRWVIPSHHNYPADAAENMAKAASAFIGLTKEQVVSDRAADHESLGVLAPDDPHAPLSGRGTRVTLRDANGGELASLIVGLPAPDPTGASAGGQATPRRYVRAPDKARVYAVQFPTTFSTRFADWVETDLLQLEGKRIDRLLVDRYEVDERAGERKVIERLSLSRVLPAPVAPDAPKWTAQCQPPQAGDRSDVVNNARVDEALSALADLKIVGVRPKPPALADALAGKASNVGQADYLDLQARGFFVTRDGKFVANEGEVTATAEDGVVYNIAFGEVLFGRDEELSAGVVRDKSETAEGDGPSAGTESRYALVRVSFDPLLFPEPAPPPPAEPGAEPSGEDGQPPAQAREADAAQKEYERLRAERDANIAAGKARADALTRRFADWYFVIDAKSFAALRPTCAEVTTAPASEQAPAVGPQGPLAPGS